MGPLRAGVIAATASGIPSTVHALVTGRNVLAATRAAGTLLPGSKPTIIRGAVAHAIISTGWTTVISTANKHWKLGITGGAAAGLAIAALDLGIAAKRYPAVRALPQLPQILDHVAFGAILGGLL
ncbi:hypothetical protein [Actinocrispum sp. NPDC049592]|uniref:hypothetical protein n=1 Tax=Actinocrispum sp. NPDC049592 TaxID=3154835 RepID=UPI0034263765